MGVDDAIADALEQLNLRPGAGDAHFECVKNSSD
jgi:hypothetical protein